MNINNSIIYFLFGIIILSIIILIILIFESESNESDLSETNLNETNETNLNSKSSCPIHNPKILQIGLGTIGLSGILILSNKYFNIKSGGKSKSIIKKGKIKKLILGSNPVDPNFILDETYIGTKIKRLKDENIEIIKLLKYINIIDLSNDMNYYYTQKNNPSISILNNYKKIFNSNILYPKLIECYKSIINKRISELKQEINEGLLKSDKFRKELNSKAITIFNKDVFNQDILKQNKNNIINKTYKGNILNNNIFEGDRNNSFDSVKDLGLNDFSLYKTRLQEIYQYQNRLQNITGSAPVRSKFDKIPKSTINKPTKEKITDEQKEEFNKTVINTSISEDKKQQINEEINQIEIQNIDINPIYLYPEDNKDSDNNIITDLNNKEITYDSLINEFVNFNILKDEFITYKIMFDNCSNETVGHLEIMSEYIYELSYKLFKLFIRNSCEYFELNTKNDKCKTCFTLINSELSLLRNQLNQSIKNYNTISQKNKELEQLNLQLNEQNVKFNNKIESLEKTKDEYINNNAELKVEIKNLNEVINQNNEKIEQLTLNNTRLNTNNNQQQQQIQDLEKKIQDLNNLNDQSNSEIKKLNGKIIDNNDKIENLKNIIKELKNQMEESSKMAQEEINQLNNQIIELKNQHNKEIEQLKKDHEDKENKNYNDYTSQLKDINTRYNDSITSIEQSKIEEKKKFDNSIKKLSKEKNELETKYKKLITENNTLKKNVSLSNDVSDKIINTISNDIQLTLDIINKYKNQINDLNLENKTKIKEFTQLFIDTQQNNYIKINESDYKSILMNLKEYLNKLDESTELNESNEEFASILNIDNNLRTKILSIIDSIENDTKLEDDVVQSRLVRQISQEDSDINKNIKLQNKKSTLINIVNNFYSNFIENNKDLKGQLNTKFNISKKNLELIINNLNKEKYFNNSTQLLKDLDRLNVYDENNIYNLNILVEYLSRFSESEKWNIKIIDEFKNTYIKNYVTNIILQIKLYSQIIILNKIFKFVSSLIESLKTSQLNLDYFNKKLNKIKFKSKYQFNTIIGNQDNGLKGKFNVAETDENIIETLSYNDLVDNILKFLEVGNITETDLVIDIPIKYYDIEDQLSDNKFKTINQHLSGFMNLLINKLTKLDIIKDKENIVKDIIDDSNNLINNINNKYQNEIIRLNDELNKQNELNNEFNKNTNDILAEYEKIITNGYNNFIIYGKQYTNKVKDLLIKEKNINKYNKEKFNNQKKEILENILILINSDTNFSINNINPIKNYEDLINLLIEFDIYIDVLLELNNKFIEQILNENKLLINENNNLNNKIQELELKITSLENLQSQSIEIEKLNSKQTELIKNLELEITDLKQKNQLTDKDYKILKEFNNHIKNIINNKFSLKKEFNYSNYEPKNQKINPIVTELISTYNSQINNILFDFFNRIKNLFSTFKDSIQDPNESLDDYINKIYIFIEQEINKINQQLKELQNINNMQNEECKQKILGLQQNIETLSKTNTNLQNQIEQQNKKIEDLTMDNNMLNQKYNILEKQINLLKIEYNNEIQKLTNSNQQELNNKIKELTEIKNKLEELKDEKNKIIDKIIESNLINGMEDNQIYNLPVIVDILIEELKQNRININKLTDLNKELTNSTKELTDLNTDLIKTHTLELQKLNKAKDELNNKLTEEINKLKTDRTNNNINILKYKTKIEILENAKIKLLTENKELRNKIVNLEKQLTENNTKITELEKIIVEKEKYDEIIVENSILNDKINKLIEENKQLKSEKEKLLSELENELTILKDEISNENIKKETNINTLKDIIKNNTLLIMKLNIKNKRLNEQIIKLQKENEEYKNKQLEMIIEKNKDNINNIEFIKKYKELENKYKLNLNELGQIKEIVNDYKTKLSEALSKNKLTLEEKEKLAIEIVQLKETNLLLNEELIQQKNLIEQKKELLKQKEEMILNKLNEIEELKNRIKNININRLNDLKNKDQDLKNKEKELLFLKQQHENIIKQIKQENFKLELDLKKQIVQLSKDKDTLNLSIQNLTTNNTNLTTELDNLKKLQENEIKELIQKLLQLQTENGTLKSTIANLNEETKKLNNSLLRCKTEKNNTLLNEDKISNLTLQLETCNNVKKDIYNLLTNKIAELEQTNNNNNTNKDAKIAELTSLLALNNSELIKKEEEKEKKIEELNKNQLELEKAHALAITNLTNEFNKIKEEINNENLQNNQKEILKLNKQCDNKIEQLENSITNLTKIGNESNLNIESKINEINKLKESYKIESEKLKKQNIVYYFKNLRLSTIIQNLNNNIEQLKNDNTTNINNLTDKEKLITELQKELDRIKKILEDLEEEKKKMNSKYQNEFNNCKKELDKCTNNLNECTNKLENCNNDRNSKENRIEQYKNELGLKDNIIEQIQKDKQALQERLNVLNTILATTSNDKISKLSQENQKLVKENQDLQNQLKSLKTSTPVSTSTSIPVGTPASTYSLPPIIDEYAYYSNHPYITKRATKLIENISDNDAYSKFIKKTRNELIV